MKNNLIYYLFITLSIILNSCSEGFKEEYSKFSLVLKEVTAITTPTTDTTPDYTFSSTESGTITYGGSCSSSTTSAISGNNTITLSPLSDGTYADCTIKVSITVTTNKSVTNLSDSLTITSFTVSSTVSSSDDSSSANPITAGQYHSCAILGNASVKCWGRSNLGNLGIGTTDDRGNEPGEMAALSSINLGTGRTATSISGSNVHTCALLDNASVKCWGHGENGRLGQGNPNNLGDGANEMGDNLPSIDLGTGRTATAIAAGGTHSCAILDNGSVKCWGGNSWGQLGLDYTPDNLGHQPGEMGDNLSSINLGTGRTATAIAAGIFHSCAILDNGSVKCWGRNAHGQLGIDNTTDMGDNTGHMAQLTGINLGTGRTATAIAAGYWHSCALLDNASVKCWGRNNYGQLGIDNVTIMGDNTGEMAQLTGINLGTGRTATAIAAGHYHSCAILDNGSVKCWGLNNYGQLGIDSTTAKGNISGSMAGLSSINLGTGRTATAIAAGGWHSCALLDNASVKCWGINSKGQLGIDSTTAKGNISGDMADLTGIDL
jgi:alpha-tubulin suppressor-like RCC1 family protein